MMCLCRRSKHPVSVTDQMGSPLQSLLLAVLCLSPLILPVANGALSVNQESEYLASFDDMISASYSEPRPNELTSACAAKGSNTVTNRVSISGGITTASQVSALCGADDICVIEAGSTLQMSSSLVVGALEVKGAVVWDDATQSGLSQWLCAGFIAVSGNFTLHQSADSQKRAWIYLMDNSAMHEVFGMRSFSADVGSYIEIQGAARFERTWSLLARAASTNDNTMTLMHDPAAMGWAVGDRIVAAPTQHGCQGTAEASTIASIAGNNITLEGSLSQDLSADFKVTTRDSAALMSAEVINLQRSTTTFRGLRVVVCTYAGSRPAPLHTLQYLRREATSSSNIGLTQYLEYRKRNQHTTLTHMSVVRP